MNFKYFILFSLFTFFINCEEKKSEKKVIFSTILVEVLGPKDKGIFDSANVPENLKDEVRKITKFNYFDTGTLGKIDSISYFEEDNPFFEFEKLKNKANIKELYQLTFNKNIPVSLYSSIAISKKIPKLTSIFYSRILNIEKKVYSQNGCLVGDLHPSEIFYNEYLKNIDEKEEKTDQLLEILDSIYNSLRFESSIKTSFISKKFS